MHIKLERDAKIKSGASLYIPPEGSRNYDEANLKRYFEIAAALDVCGGDLNFRGTPEDWNIIGGDMNDEEEPPNFRGWRRESTRREKEMLRAWPYNLRAVSPRTSADMAARIDWKSDKGYLIDSLLIQNGAQCGGYTTTAAPPQVSTEHLPVTARIRWPWVATSKSGRRF